MLHAKPSKGPKSSKLLHEIVYSTNRLRRLLVLGADEASVVAMEAHFSALGWQVDCALEKEEAEALLCFRRYAAVVTDLSLSGPYRRDGLEIISHVRARCPQTSVFFWHSQTGPESPRTLSPRHAVSNFLPRPQLQPGPAVSQPERVYA